MVATGRDVQGYGMALAGSASGVVCAERAGGAWKVERVLAGRDVRGLAVDAGTAYAGAEGHGER